jgi:5'-deoxynucleotidase YfbR-like HD superfamily hydrolase
MSETTVHQRGILEMIRLATIPRWTIVEVYPPQTVAAHSYRVWLLATDLYGYLFPVEHNSFENVNVGKLAILHDVEERWSGDMPTPLKDALEKIHPGICETLTDHILNDNIPSVAGFMRGVKRSIPWHVVKIADTVEAYLYLSEYAINRDRAAAVLSYLLGKLNERFGAAQNSFKSVDWNRAREWCRQALDFPRINHSMSQDIGALYGKPANKDSQGVSDPTVPKDAGPQGLSDGPAESAPRPAAQDDHRARET